MIRPILTDNDPLLREISLPVTEFDKTLADLVVDLLDTVIEHGGMGIASPQIGVLKRVIAVSDDCNDFIIMVNPKIVYKGKLKTEHMEQCLSFGPRRFFVKRPYSVTVEYQDINGSKHTLDAKSWLAYCVIHEEQHCNGLLLPDVAIKEIKL